MVVEQRRALGRAPPSARFGECLAVDQRLALQIVDRDVGVVPREPGSNAKALRQLNHAILSEPRLGARAALPEVDAAGAAVAVEVVFSDQTLRSKAAIDQGCRGPTLHGLLLGSFRQVELDDDDAVAHERCSTRIRRCANILCPTGDGQRLPRGIEPPRVGKALDDAAEYGPQAPHPILPRRRPVSIACGGRLDGASDGQDGRDVTEPEPREAAKT